MVVPFLRSNGKYSLYNTANDNLEDESNNLFFELTNYSCIQDEEYDFIHPFVEGYAIAIRNEQSFFIGPDGKVLKTEHQYLILRNFENGIAPVSRENYDDDYRWRFINRDGIEIIDRSFDEYYVINKEFIEVREYSGWQYDSYSRKMCPIEYSIGLLSSSGNLIIEPKKGASIYIQEGFIEVSTKDYRGTYYQFFDFDGNELKVDRIEQLEYVGPIYKNRGVVLFKGSANYNVIDRHFRILGYMSSEISSISIYTNAETESLTNFVRGLCTACKGGKWGFVNERGQFVLKPKYDYLYGYLDNSQWKGSDSGSTVVGRYFGRDMKYAIMNSNFEEITRFEFDDVCPFSEGIAAVRVGDYWGAVDALGHVIVPIEFDHVSSFSEGIAAVRVGDYWGAVDTLGQVVVPIKFNSISSCEGGVIQVGLGDYYQNEFIGYLGYYHKSSKQITKIIYERLFEFKDGYAITKMKGRYYLMNEKGNWVSSIGYDNIEISHKPTYLVKLDEKRFYIDTYGREFREC